MTAKWANNTKTLSSLFCNDPSFILNMASHVCEQLAYRCYLSVLIALHRGSWRLCLYCQCLDYFMVHKKFQSLFRSCDMQYCISPIYKESCLLQDRGDGPVLQRFAHGQVDIFFYSRTIRMCLCLDAMSNHGCCVWFVWML